MGSAACCHLARRGARVLGLEQFTLPHERGSHHGHSRMIRQSYYEHPDYVPLLCRAYELWEHLEAEEGHGVGREQLLYLTGGLYVGPADGEIVPGALAAARAHGLSHELLERHEVERRFPAFRIPEGFLGFYEERAGLLVPELAVAALARQAERAGAELRTGEGILAWESTPQGVTVRTATGTYRAAHLVVTAGAWSGALLRSLGARLETTRQVLAWFEPAGEAGSFTPGRFPCWFVETETPYGHYGFPMMDSRQGGLKVALHKPGRPIDPDRLGGPDDAVAPAESEALRDFLREYLPEGAGPLLATRTCLYTNSPDGHFLLGHHPAHPSVTIAAGFSGHGFKFASVIGEALAELALDGASSLPIAFLRPERFLETS